VGKIACRIVTSRAELAILPTLQPSGREPEMHDVAVGNGV